MSGYQPMSLVLATMSKPVAPVADAVYAYLRAKHGYKEGELDGEHSLISTPHAADITNELGWDAIEHPTPDEIAEGLDLEYAVRVGQEIRIGRWRFSTAMFYAPVAKDAFSLTIKLESSILEAVHCWDEMLEQFDEDAKQGLVELCLGVTDAAGASGFLLERDTFALQPVSADEILRELHERNRRWSIGGVEQSLISREALTKSETGRTRPVRDIYTSTTGLTVYDLVFPRKY